MQAAYLYVVLMLEKVFVRSQQENRKAASKKAVANRVVMNVCSRLYRVALWVSVIAFMAVIFAFSAQPGEASEAMTKGAVRPVAELLAALQHGGEAATNTLYVILGTLLRKLAHVCEYALLGALLWLLLDSYGRQGRLTPLLIAVLYAVCDEVHQAFVPGRLGTPWDVLVDALGAITGVLLIAKIAAHWRRKHGRMSDSP